MKKENAVIFGVTGVVVAAVLIGGGIYMKTERDRNLNADTASTAADSNRAEEVQKAVFLAEDSGLWYLGDLEHGNIYVTHTPSDTLYDENGNAIDPSEIKKGDFLQVEGDGIMLNSYPGQYPGISRIMRISGGTEADAEKFDEELSQILPEKDPSEIPFLNLCYTQPNAQVTAMATQGGYTWSYVDEDGNGQNVVADSAFILEWTELSDLNIENDEGKNRSGACLLGGAGFCHSRKMAGRRPGAELWQWLPGGRKRFCGACGELEHSGSRGRLHLRSGRGIRKWNRVIRI